jgi:hypothetical protein
MPTPSRRRVPKPDRRALELLAGCGAESPSVPSKD